MKSLLLISLLFCLTGCSFIYDSRGENQISNPTYKGVTAKAVKTGRLIKLKVLKK
jgi:hypothetical protein